MAREDGNYSAFASLLMDFRPVPRVIIFLGFAAFVAGVFHGFNLYNRTLLIGACLLSAGFAGNYWPDVTFGPMYTDDETSGGMNWGNLLLAIVFSILSLAAGIQA